MFVPALADIAEKSLRRDIVHGFWRPRDWLRLDDLRGRYGVGASPLREALSWLIGESLVRLENKRLPRRRPERAGSPRRRVDARCARVCGAPRGDRAWGLRLGRWNLRGATTPHAGTLTTGTDRASLDSWDDAHVAFHAALIANCGNIRALEMQQRLAGQHRRYRISLMGENMPRGKIVNEHRSLAEGNTCARDIEEAVVCWLRKCGHTSFSAEALRVSVVDE